MKRTGAFGLKAALLIGLATIGLAAAQHPLAGTYLEHDTGFLVVLEEGPGGGLTGAIHGDSGPLPLTLQSDHQTASGWFMLQGQQVGFSAQLHADGSTLLIWAYELDANGQPVAGTVEQSTATRQQGFVPQIESQPPLVGAPPVNTPPGVAPPPEAAPPAGIDSPAPAGAAAQLPGSWRGSAVLGGIPFELTAEFRQDGVFREEAWFEGALAVWYEGTWTVGQDNLLNMTVTGLSPQFCMAGTCSTNINPGSTQYRLQFHSADSMTVTATDQPTGQPAVSVTYLRAR